MAQGHRRGGRAGGRVFLHVSAGGRHRCGLERHLGGGGGAAAPVHPHPLREPAGRHARHRGVPRGDPGKRGDRGAHVRVDSGEGQPAGPPARGLPGGAPSAPAAPHGRRPRGREPVAGRSLRGGDEGRSDLRPGSRRHERGGGAPPAGVPDAQEAVHPLEPRRPAAGHGRRGDGWARRRALDDRASVERSRPGVRPRRRGLRRARCAGGRRTSGVLGGGGREEDDVGEADRHRHRGARLAAHRGQSQRSAGRHPGKHPGAGAREAAAAPGAGGARADGPRGEPGRQQVHPGHPARHRVAHDAAIPAWATRPR
jgi:hypothetical protein